VGRSRPWRQASRLRLEECAEHRGPPKFEFAVTLESARFNGAWLPDTMLTVLRRSLLIRGFINTEFVSEHYNEFLREIEPMVATGRIRFQEHMVDGLDAAPSAFIGMLEGRNLGKVIIKFVQ
jgi:NADPH-dependent curcumin reductase CurA